MNTQGRSLDLIDEIKSALIQCDEIISLTSGINFEKDDEPIVIEANYIESSNTNDGVIKCNNSCNLVLRNAKIKNTYNLTSTPYSRGIYITDNSDPEQKIELENLIIVTGSETNDNSIYRDGNSNIDIKNLLLFVNRGISNHITFVIGDQLNLKYIEDTLIS